MNKLFCSLFVAISALSAQSEIVVHLKTQSLQKNIYLSHFFVDKSSFEPSYLGELEEILRSDLNRSALLSVITPSLEQEQRLKAENYRVAFADDLWTKEMIQGVVKASIHNEELSLLVFDVNGLKLKHLAPIKLGGENAVDRREIHRVADAIHQILTQKIGVASSKILFSLQLPKKGVAGLSAQSEIWECDYDGSNLRQVTHEGHYAITPVYFPPRQGFLSNKFLYVSYKTGIPKIHLSSLTDGVGKPLLSLRGNQLLPAISRDRSKIAFICDASGRADLFIQNMDAELGPLGKPNQIYSWSGAVHASPTFNPSGSKVAFVSDKEGTPRIYVVNLDDARGKNLPVASCITRQNKENTSPSWSPDGTKLAYSAKSDRIREIWIFDFETGEETQLTSGSVHKENPSWAPDSLHLVYNTVDGEAAELFVIDLIHKKPLQITRGIGKKHYPAWEP